MIVDREYWKMQFIALTMIITLSNINAVAAVLEKVNPGDSYTNRNALNRMEISIKKVPFGVDRLNIEDPHVKHKIWSSSSFTPADTAILPREQWMNE